MRFSGRPSVPRPPAFDVALVVVLLVVAVLEDLFFPVEAAVGRSTREPDVLAFVFILVGIVPLMWRRTNPLPVLVLNGVGFFGRFLLGYVMVTGLQISPLVAIYSVGAFALRPAANTMRWVALAVAAVAFPAAVVLERNPPFLVSLMVLTWLGAGFLGETVYVRRQYQRALEERALRLEVEQEERALRAVTEERARIARDLHDVWAHTMGLIVVQAGAAQEVFDTQPHLARQALGTIQDAGRKALDEVRRMVTREGAGEAPRSPAPGIGDLDGLVDEFRQAGLPVEITRMGRFDDVPSDAALTVFRIIQQALTNTLSHGGPEASATVELTRDREVMRILVEDDGLGAEAPVADHDGQGLIGMRERVSLFDGTLVAGPLAHGGFRVEARIPIEALP